MSWIMMSLQSQGRFRDSGAEIPWRDADQLPSSELQLSEPAYDDHCYSLIESYWGLRWYMW
jgi:hypothetical protein